MYISMSITEEKGLAGRTVYRVLRFLPSGKVCPVPWTFAARDSAERYIAAHFSEEE